MTEDARLTARALRREGETVIIVKGEIDVATCEILRDAIEPHMGPNQRIVLDLSGVDFTDSSLLNVLARARTRVGADSASLVLRNPSKIARRLLTLVQAQQLVDAVEEVDPPRSKP